MMSELAGWCVGGASLYYTHKNFLKSPWYMQLHDVLAMKTWFKLILYVKGYEKSKDTTFYY
jgi:hypothetical protein